MTLILFDCTCIVSGQSALMRFNKRMNEKWHLRYKTREFSETKQNRAKLITKCL